MSGVTVRYKATFGKKPAPKPKTKSANPRPVSRAARMLALAYYVERLVDSGEIGGYAAAARMLGISRARMSQIMNLLSLSPKVQEDILIGQLEVSERRLRGTQMRQLSG